MTPHEKLISLRLLSALAWADGVLTEKELEALVDFLSDFGPWEGWEIKDSLRQTTTLDDELVRELSELSKGAFAEALSTGHAMIHAERPATDGELAIVRRASEARLGADAWPKVEEWLAAQRRARALWAEVFG